LQRWRSRFRSNQRHKNASILPIQRTLVYLAIRRRCIVASAHPSRRGQKEGNATSRLEFLRGIAYAALRLQRIARAPCATSFLASLPDSR
jgi:hypothetical protein